MSLKPTAPEHPGHANQVRTVTCHYCGQEVYNVRYPDHLRGTDGEHCPARHGDGGGA